MQSKIYALNNLEIVFLKSRFPENVGMLARACANMGAGGITLVQPELWNAEKARPLATSKANYLLENIKINSSLSKTLAPYSLVVGTTARTGGWRKQLLHPSKVAQEIVEVLKEGDKVALLLGPEDKGLNNEEIEYCHRLVTIPTAIASSLNVAQAGLILLYECFNAAHIADENKALPSDVEHKRICSEDAMRLMDNLKESLVLIDFLPKDNPDYFFMPLRRLLGRIALRRHEYDALMGMCRQIKNKCK